MSKSYIAFSFCSNAAMICDCVFVLYRKDLASRPSYSLAAWDLPRRNVRLAEDITDRPEIAEHFLHLLLQERVSPCHIVDILEDSLPLR